VSYTKTDAVTVQATGTELYFREFRPNTEDVRSTFSLRVRHLPDGRMDWVIQETTWKMGKSGQDKPYTRLICASFEGDAAAQIKDLVSLEGA
jgi:hypothetical protein